MVVVIGRGGGRCGRVMLQGKFKLQLRRIECGCRDTQGLDRLFAVPHHRLECGEWNAAGVQLLLLVLLVCGGILVRVIVVRILLVVEWIVIVLERTTTTHR